MVIYFGFVMKTVLITSLCFRYSLHRVKASHCPTSV